MEFTTNYNLADWGQLEHRRKRLEVASRVLAGLVTSSPEVWSVDRVRTAVARSIEAADALLDALEE